MWRTSLRGGKAILLADTYGKLGQVDKQRRALKKLITLSDDALPALLELEVVERVVARVRDPVEVELHIDERRVGLLQQHVVARRRHLAVDKLGKLFGLAVIVTCGSDAKCRAAERIGADHAINYRTQDFVERVLALTGDKGAQLCLDMVAGSYTQRNLDCLAEDGRLVTIAVLGGAKAEINMAGLMVRRQTMTGSTLRGRSNAFKELLADEIARTVWPLVEEGRLRPEMDLVFPLAEAPAAHARMEAGEHIGKIVLKVAP